jgi:hypothetical protein
VRWWWKRELYKRYGGRTQQHPLTPAEQLFDDTIILLNEITGKIWAKRLSLFTAHDYLWYSNKHLIPASTQSDLDQLLKKCSDLLKKLEDRESEQTPPGRADQSPTEPQKPTEAKL